jgi:uncharacterized repeat protein (TIGR03803 family)
MRKYRIVWLILSLVAGWQMAPLAHGQIPGVTFTALAQFDYTNNGANPYTPPVLGADGNLYGTLPFGGTNGIGTIYKVTTNGSRTTLYTFKTNFNKSNGANPYGALASGGDGNLYGVAYQGGTNNQGTLFKITSNGAFTLLYSFGLATNAPGYALDGANPLGALVQGRDGNYYGTTSKGGTNNLGTVFQFSTNGALTTLHSFSGTGTNDDGAAPYAAPLVESADGVFYGTTSAGGTNNYGTLFRITSDGALTTLFEFSYTDGRGPLAGLSFGTDGNLYGTTSDGGANGYGTVFQITTNGVLTTVFNFGGADQLYYLYGGVAVGNDNTLFGTTHYYSTNYYGAVFQLTTNGLLTRLHVFTNGVDGANPYAGVIRDAAGNLYGAAYYGGTNGDNGTVYRLSFTTLASILSPPANGFWSDGIFTGTASDNAPGGAITNVSFSFNGAAWTNATTSNGWINWTAEGALIPGTNTLAAYAADAFGNVSPTNTVKFVYGAALAVSTNGLGSLSTNLNGVMLPVGNSYAITAAPGSGFVFTNWTGGTNLPLTWLTNGTTVRFVMKPNLMLQANFLDITKPTLSITNVTAGMTVSNADFTVRGKAGDNWQVTNVFYKLNGGDWSNAATTNNWTNWSAAVTLVPGTNAIAAYAADPAGGTSLTNTVSFQFVVTNQLQIRAAGLGTISPNYSNTWLQIGRNYAMTAAAASGFAFTNWTISTNWLGGVTTNNATVQFMMASNLTLQVAFLDITKPTLAVSSPAAGQHMTNALANLTGTASDNWKVAGVWYQLNGNVWNLVNTTNGYTNWTKTVTLLTGTNTLNIYAQDLGGNYSATNSISVVSSNTFKLQLAFAAGQPLAADGLNFMLQVSTNVNGRILVSTDLLNWLIFTNFTGTNATLNFRDAAATNFNQRFYRAVTP